MMKRKKINIGLNITHTLNRGSQANDKMFEK